MSFKEKLKKGTKNLAIAYAVLGSLYMLGTPNTGHYSADLHLGYAKPTNIEQKLYEPIFNKFNIENKF